jgi:uncharacterized YccA/Bax inhibitor family protein
MRSSNPVLTRRDAFSSGGGYATFDRTASDRDLQSMYDGPSATSTQTGRMTIDDVVARTAITLLTLLAAAGLTWFMMDPDAEPNLGIPLIAGLVGFVLALVITFKRVISPPLILAYAAIEGVFIGGISFFYNQRFEGIVFQAVLGTMAAFIGMLIAYKSGRIRVTPRFTKILIGATIGFLLLAVTNLVLAMVGVGDGGGLHLREAGPLGIAFGAIGVVLASLFLVLDFHQIDEGIKLGAPEKESWLAAFGLTVTLVWLYLEILRLLAILRGED